MKSSTASGQKLAFRRASAAQSSPPWQSQQPPIHGWRFECTLISRHRSHSPSVRFEFMQCVVRVAIAKYVRPKTILDTSDALVEFLEKDVLRFGYSSREYVLLHAESGEGS